MEEIITLDYGSGGLRTSQLIESVLVPAFQNPALEDLGDGAVLPSMDGPLVYSTDSFVVTPWRFPGGDIGKLAVCGTVNDVCMAGGQPKYLSLSFIIEEGFLMEDFKTIVNSIATTAQLAGVQIVTGDTKVVERGKGDGIYINTSGVGPQRAAGLSRKAICPGDAVLVSGSVGCHGAAVLMAREKSPLRRASLRLPPAAPAQRGGAGSGRRAYPARSHPRRRGHTLNEFVEGSALTIELEEDAIPVDPAVAAACDLLGLDPLYSACEGRMLAIVSPARRTPVLDALHQTSGGEHAAMIGRVTESRPGHVVLRTALGGSRILGKLTGAQLPRIC